MTFHWIQKYCNDLPSTACIMILINWSEMHWYLTVTHISDCEINSVALNTMPLICKCYKNGLCNIIDWSNKFILSAPTLAVNHCRVLSNLKHSQLDIMAHNSFANRSLHSHIAHDYSPLCRVIVPFIVPFVLLNIQLCNAYCYFYCMYNSLQHMTCYMLLPIDYLPVSCLK